MTRLHSDMVWGVVDQIASPAGRDDVLSTARDSKLVAVRQAIAATLFHDCALSSTTTGRMLGRDHTTILYSVHKVARTPRLQALHAFVKNEALQHATVCTKACRNTHLLRPVATLTTTERGELCGLPFPDAWAALRPATRDIVEAIAEGLTMAEIQEKYLWGKNKYVLATAEICHLLDLNKYAPQKIAAWYWKGRMAALEAVPKPEPRYGLKKPMAA